MLNRHASQKFSPSIAPEIALRLWSRSFTSSVPFDLSYLWPSCHRESRDRFLESQN